jgi:large subunit ribosomal protein L29
MKAKEIRELSIDQLQEKLTSLNEELFTHRFTAKTGNLENTSQISNIRKDIAKIKTILNERARATV